METGTANERQIVATSGAGAFTTAALPELEPAVEHRFQFSENKVCCKEKSAGDWGNCADGAGCRDIYPTKLDSKSCESTSGRSPVQGRNDSLSHPENNGAGHTAKQKWVSTHLTPRFSALSDGIIYCFRAKNGPGYHGTGT